MRTTLTLALVILAFSSIGQKTPKIPRSIRKSVPLLAEYLTQNCTSNQQKVDSIYYWITHNIAYDYAVIASSKPLEYKGTTKTLKSKKAICTGYVDLMIDLLAEEEIQAESIEGYVRDFDPSYDYLLTVADHVWLAVKLDDTWKLCDPTWDSGYEGRIPKKVKTYPKRWLKERPKAKEKRTSRIDRKKKNFDEKQKNRDPYTSKIGFVRSPKKEYYLIESDSFLVSHLPTIPEWQLREQSISIEQFCKPSDSVKRELELPRGEVIDYEDLTEQFVGMNLLERWLYIAERGHEYNPSNYSVKAIHYHNAVAIHMGTDLKKILERYPKFKTIPIWEDLIPKADTAILYSKLSLQGLKEGYKAQNIFYKDNFKQEATAQKTLLKEAERSLKAIEKLTETAGSSNDRIEKDYKYITEKLTAYSNYANKTPELSETSDELSVILEEFGAINLKIDTILNKLSNYREVSAQQGVLDHIEYADYYCRYGNEYVALNTINVRSKIHLYDSLSLERTLLIKSTIEDSVTNEILSKELVSSVKELERLAKSSKTKLRSLQDAGKLHSAAKAESHLFTIVHSRMMQAQQELLNSRGYNKNVIQNAKIFRSSTKNLISNIEILGKSKKDRDKEELKELDIDKEREEKTFKEIQENAKKWKSELKKKLKD